jgi:hypothetical protein
MRLLAMRQPTLTKAAAKSTGTGEVALKNFGQEDQKYRKKAPISLMTPRAISNQPIQFSFLLKSSTIADFAAV